MVLEVVWMNPAPYKHKMLSFLFLEISYTHFSLALLNQQKFVYCFWLCLQWYHRPDCTVLDGLINSKRDKLKIVVVTSHVVGGCLSRLKPQPSLPFRPLKIVGNKVLLKLFWLNWESCSPGLSMSSGVLILLLASQSSYHILTYTSVADISTFTCICILDLRTHLVIAWSCCLVSLGLWFCFSYHRAPILCSLVLPCLTRCLILKLIRA